MSSSINCCQSVVKVLLISNIVKYLIKNCCQSVVKVLSISNIVKYLTKNCCQSVVKVLSSHKIQISLKLQERKKNVDLKKSKNRQNPSWLHKYRETILNEVQNGKPLREIAELLAENANNEGKKISRQILSVYLKRYPFEQAVTKPIQTENALAVTNFTTEKESIISTVAKQAADDVFSPVEQNRVVTKPDLITPPKQQNAEPDNVKKSGRLSDRLKKRNVGKFEPDSSPEDSEYL